MSKCPLCDRQATELVLLPMSFREIDEARKATLALANSNRGRKRKSSIGSSDGSDVERSFIESSTKADNRRTGRWTCEEIAYVDLIIENFEKGQLPLVDGMKLNDFLSNMLKSKQSRLTKKMKNAKLSTRAFRRTTGYIVSQEEARKFSDLEDAFCYSIQDHKERAEMKFHMQKEWRDLFSQYCVTVGQPVDADQWLGSVEEMDRRITMAKDIARRAKRKLMIGNALRQDVQNPDKGVFIDRSGMEQEREEDDLLGDAYVYDDVSQDKRNKTPPNPSPFLSKAHGYILRHNVPFEHMDVWVPSYVPSKEEDSCRLCYAGCATSDVHVVAKGQPPKPLTAEEFFKLTAFGEYSQKFSFQVGCGLPGRVYQSGDASWEQSVQYAPLQHFERCGGALECGIKTVVGIPIVSPTVGRIIVILYSRFDRGKDPELVDRLSKEFTKLLPTPAWKLVVDLGNPCVQTVPEVEPTPTQTQTQTEKKDARVDDIISILGEHMPSDSSSPLFSFLPGFMSLRLLLLRPQSSWSEPEIDIGRIMFGSFSSYSNAGRSRKDIALLLARDYMFLMQSCQPIKTDGNYDNVIPSNNIPLLASPPTRDSVSIISN